MIPLQPFLVGAGPLQDQEMRAGSLSLSEAWGGELLQHCCSENPQQVLGALANGQGLVQLSGDVAMVHPGGGSWLEALGAWRQPIILLVKPMISGEIPGVAPAYVALCSLLAVPLVGVVQLGGRWTPQMRRADGLPWCGWISDGQHQQHAWKAANGDISSQEIEPEAVAAHLRRRMLNSI